MKIKVVDWISWKQAKNLQPSVDLSGGYVHGHNWEQYLGFNEIEHDEEVPYLLALKKEIIKNKIKFSGCEHQELKRGVPLFNDNTVAVFTFRGWGDLLAAIWNTEENTDRYTFQDFYC